MPDRYVKATSDMCSDFCCPKDRLHPPPPPVTGCELDGHAAVCKARAHTHTCHHPGTPQREKAHRDPPATLSARYRGRRRSLGWAGPCAGLRGRACRASMTRPGHVHRQTDGAEAGTPRPEPSPSSSCAPSATRRVATYAPYAPCSSNARPPENEIHTCSRGRGPRHTAVNTSRTHML